MPKYYVECGPVRIIVAAESVEHAALVAVDRGLQPHTWIYDDPDLSDRDRREHLMLEALLHLDPAVCVSEQGFDRSDAALVGTPETVEQWHRLMAGASRLFEAAGLPARAMILAADRMLAGDRDGQQTPFRLTNRRPR